MFNPYREWLGIPEDEKAPHFYQLLGLQPFEADSDVISRAADRVMMYVRTFQAGEFSSTSQKILNELSHARVTLLSPESKKKYDTQLRHKLAAKLRIPAPAAPILSSTIPVAPMPVAVIPQAQPLNPPPVAPAIAPHKTPSSLSSPLAPASPRPVQSKSSAEPQSFSAAFPPLTSGTGSSRSRSARASRPKKSDSTTLVVVFSVVLVALLLFLWGASQFSSVPSSDSASKSAVSQTILPPPSTDAFDKEDRSLESTDAQSVVSSTNNDDLNSDARSASSRIVSSSAGQSSAGNTEITGIASDFNGWVATAGQDGVVRLWIPRSGKQIRGIDSDKKATRCTAFSPNGKLLLSGGEDNLIHLWNVMDGTSIQDFVGHGGAITALEFSPSQQLLLSASMDGTLSVWETEFGVLLKTFHDTGSAIWSACWSPDGKRIASGGDEGRICIWNVELGQMEHELLGHQGAVRCLQYSPDGLTLASGSNDGNLRLWDPATGNNTGVVRSNMAEVHGLAFSPDGKRIAACGLSDLIRIYSSSDLSRPILSLNTGHAEQTAMDWSRDGRYLLVCSKDGHALFYHPETGTVAGELVAPSPLLDGKFYCEKTGQIH